MAAYPPVAFGVVGLGGYAGSIRSVLVKQAASSPPPVKLVSVCDPDLTTNAKAADEARAAGAAVFDSLDALLASPVEAVWLPVPIDLHRPFTEQALAAGKAVMCEKPATGCIDDLNAMIAARDRAKLPVGIGFQDSHAESTAMVKRRLLDGELGRITHATVYACWPRDDRYYARASWAGAMKRNGTWVLDSPAHNAISHYITLPLFLLGPTMGEAAVPQTIEAELYRARPIECFDTISLRVTLPGGVKLLVLMTHACARMTGPVIRMYGERGRLTHTTNEILMEPRDGSPTTVAVGDKHGDMVRRFAALVRGQVDPDRPVVSLELARHQLVCVNASVQATPIHTVPNDRTTRGVHAIAGIEKVFEQCAAKNQMIHESGLAPWSNPAGTMDVRAYTHFAGPFGA